MSTRAPEPERAAAQTSELAIDVYAGNFDLPVIFELGSYGIDVERFMGWFDSGHDG